MTAKSNATAATSGDETHLVGSDLKRVDAHVIGSDEYAEIPELDPSWLVPVEVTAEGSVRRRGRPTKPDAKRQVTLRLSPSVLDYFRATGEGWQRRIDEALLGIVAAEQASSNGRKNGA
ncbi:MAG TPA: BrnA antitoxin family protein [Beijerinckiaceae bacterium]|jgi:uncharacterized protein (DUF4415 family)